MYRKCMDKRSVIEIFDEVAEKYKNKPAIVFEEECFTYRELQKRSEARMEEESYNDLIALIADAAEELSRITLPLYIYGGCFGGMCGYTNSLYAPEDIDTSEKVSELEDAAFVETIRRKGELPEKVIQDEEVLSFLLGGIRADYALYESYCFHEMHSRVLDSKITLFVKDKKETECEKYRNWSNYSVKEIAWNIVECENLFDASSQMEIAKRINQILKEDDSERVKE